MAKTANEELFDATVRHQIKLLRFSKGEAEAASAILAESEKELIQAISGLDVSDDSARLKQLLAEVRRLRVGIADKLGEPLQANLEELAETEADWEQTALEDISPVVMSFNGITAATLKGVVSSSINGTPLKGWLEKMEFNDVARIEQQMRLGVLAGETTDQLIRRLRGSKAAGYADGVFATTRREAEMVARTAVNHISTASRQAVWEANSDVIKGVRWVSTLDGRTSSPCQARDGEVYPISQGPRPPAHPNCRSSVAPVLVGEEMVGTRATIRDVRTRKQREVDFQDEAKKLAGPKWKTMSAAERTKAVAARRKAWAAERIGSTPTTTNYETWLRGQSAEFQNEVLGPTKAKLFREGMTLDKFIDEQGKPYSIQQLKASVAGDKLNVVQPGVGLKAKAYLQQGFEPAQVLEKIKAEYPDANTSMASLASYKSELKKAGALVTELPTAIPSSALAKVKNVAAVVEDLETGLPANLKQAIGGQWASVVDDLQGVPGAYGFYQAGKGVLLSGKKLAELSIAQSKQVIAHELGHLLHKQHDLLLPDEVLSTLKTTADGFSPDAKKLYSYYLSNTDELVAEIYSQAISPSPLTSQGLRALEFNKAFAPTIEAAKKAISDKFPTPHPNAPKPLPGAPAIPYEVAGKHTTVGSLAKALLQQGMPDEQVLASVLAEFPNAKTKIASIKSYKSQLKSEGLLPNKSAGPTVVPTKVTPNDSAPKLPPAEAVVAKPEAPAGTPSSIKLTKDEFEIEAKILYKAGVTSPMQILETLKAKFPLNAEEFKYSNIASWKHKWTKQNDKLKATAEAKAEVIAKAVDNAGPTVKPKLVFADLGPVSKHAWTQAKSVLIHGGTDADAYAAMKGVFGQLQEPGASDLLAAIKYDIATTKSAAKPYLDSSFKSTTPQTVKTEAPTPQAIKITPARPAARPREGFPPPPRYTAAQRRAALSVYGSPMLEGALRKVNAIQKSKGLPELEVEEVSAIKHYTGNAFRRLNTELRSRQYAANYALQAFVEAAQHGMMKMPKYVGMSSRGMSFSSTQVEQLLQQYKVGGVVEDDAFISSSAGSQSAFGGNVTMTIHGKTGVDVSFFSNYPGEREVLFMPGTRFRVDEVRQEYDRWYITVTEV